MDNEIINRNLKVPGNGIAILNGDYSLIWCSDLLSGLFKDPAAGLDKICRNLIGNESSSLAGMESGVIYEGPVEIGDSSFSVTFYYSHGDNKNRPGITAVFVDDT